VTNIIAQGAGTAGTLGNAMKKTPSLKDEEGNSTTLNNHMLD
jgi:hypothetical protein